MADWSGYFGDEYTERWRTVPNRDKWWEMIINKLGVQSVYELGCNVGGNLESIRRVSGILGSGCDVNQSAVDIARKSGLDVDLQNAIDMPKYYQMYDLVFTVGLLIHLQTPDVIKVMKNARSLSRRYVMFNEYHAEIDEEVAYRDVPHALYKRPFEKIYWAMFPNDVLLVHGYAPKSDGFDNTHWWVFEKWS